MARSTSGRFPGWRLASLYQPKTGALGDAGVIAPHEREGGPATPTPIRMAKAGNQRRAVNSRLDPLQAAILRVKL